MLLGFALNDEDTVYRADYEYLGIWKMPNKELALAVALENGLIETGFHDCLEQVNARGASLDPAVLLAHMADSSA